MCVCAFSGFFEKTELLRGLDTLPARVDGLSLGPRRLQDRGAELVILVRGPALYAVCGLHGLGVVLVATARDAVEHVKLRALPVVLLATMVLGAVVHPLAAPLLACHRGPKDQTRVGVRVGL